MASYLRHAQLLAVTSSRVLCFRTGGVGGNCYSVTAGLACPATGAAFGVTLQKGVVLGSAVAASLLRQDRRILTSGSFC